jgi:hypothetical protein
MDNLPIKTKTVHQVYYADIEKHIKYLFGKTNSLVAFHEWNNDTYYTVVVDGESEVGSINDEKIMMQWLNDDPSVYEISAEQMLHLLFMEGSIPAGEYLIEVMW